MIRGLVSHEAFISLWAVSAFAAVTLAMGKGRNPLWWVLAALGAGPLAVLLLLSLPHSGHDPAATMEPESMDLCRNCLEPVRRDAATCRYCGVDGPVARR